MREKRINKDLYEVHDGKKIWSKLKKRYLKGEITKGNYIRVGLKCIDGKIRHFQHHRVVWYLLKGEIPDGYEINHIDENKQNNHISNLNLMTHKENMHWGTGHERSISKQKGIPRPIIAEKLSKPVVAVKDGEVLMEFASTREAERNGFNQRNVSACCRKCFNREGNNYYKGYHWYFKSDCEQMQQATQSNERVACGKLEFK